MILKSKLTIRFCLLFYVIFLPEMMIGKENEFWILNPDSALMHYANAAGDCMRTYRLDETRLYLDSAKVYERQVSNPKILGYFHNAYGDYFLYSMNDTEAHKHYYEAIHWYEKAGDNELQISLHNNLAFSYIQKNDTRSLKKIIDKMKLLAEKPKVENNFKAIAYRAVAMYYNCMYERNENQILFLDSAIYYDTKVISISDSTGNIGIRPEDLAYNYINLAHNLLKKKDPDFRQITSYLKKAKESTNPSDTAMIINGLWIEGEIAYCNRKTVEAEQIFLQQLELMNQWQAEENLNLFLDVYDRLSEISEKKSNYREVAFYERKKINCLNNIHDAEKYKIISELEAKYEVNKKDAEIAQLLQINRFKERINLLSICVFFMCAIALFAIIHWQRSKKKAAYSQLQITQMEKEEALLQTKLKEEQLKDAERQKFEVLLKNHSKDTLISNMDEELEELKKEQARLINEIATHKQKVDEYEKNKNNKITFATQDPYYLELIRDLYDLISKKLKDVPEQSEYLESLRHIPDGFFVNIKKEYNGNLTVTNIKYCIYFLIKMKPKHIAECISVEPLSIRVIKTRIKNSFKLDKKLDFELFLRQMIY